MDREELLAIIEQAERESWTKLDLTDKNLTELPPEIGRLSQLKFLELTRNSLATLPAELFQLTNLISLDLHNNKIEEIPSEIGKLKNLRILGLHDNRLQMLPPEVVKLENLTTLGLWGNPDLNIPPEIVKLVSVPSRVFSYYFENVAPIRETKEDNRRPLNEVKLLLLGQGSVGKTSLMRRMVVDEFDPHENITHGINIREWQRDIDGDAIRVNVWDFGGQEIMHATHQCFLTERSVYLVVVDARQGEVEGRIHYWLKMVENYGGDSPVIVVSNKTDQHRLAFNESGLIQRFPAIRGFVHVSAATGEGIPDLLAAIDAQIAALDYLKTPLSQRWFAVKDHLEDMRRAEEPYITLADYRAYCVEVGVADESNQDTLIGYLHALGTALNFRGRGSANLGAFVLNPDWVTGAIYAIINDEALEHQHGGILTAAQLPGILKPEAFSAEMRGFILNVMEQFELCFTEDGGKTYLVPNLLPKNQPPLGDWDEAHTLLFQYEYDVLPESVFSRFVVKALHSYGSDTYWREGIILRNEGNGKTRNRALVTVHSGDAGVKGHVRLSVDGEENTRAEFLARLRGYFDLIHASVPGLRPDEVVPVPGYPQASIKYETLLANEKLGIERVAPDGMDAAVGVADLLGRVGRVEHAQVIMQLVNNGDLVLGPKFAIEHLGEWTGGDRIDIETARDIERLIAGRGGKISAR